MAGAREYQRYPVPDPKFQRSVSGVNPEVVGSAYDFLKGEYRPPGGMGVKKDKGPLGQAIDTVWEFLFGGGKGGVSKGWTGADEAQDEEARARVKADWQRKGFVK